LNQEIIYERAIELLQVANKRGLVVLYAVNEKEKRSREKHALWEYPFEKMRFFGAKFS